MRTRLSPAAFAVGIGALLPSLILSRYSATTTAMAACVIPVGALVRALLGKLVPRLASGYLVNRVLSFRYLGIAIGLPLASAVCIAAQPVHGTVGVLVLHLVLAHGYRARFERPQALRRALLPAAMGGFAVALECLALSGREWQLGGRLLYAEESPRQRLVLVERAGSLEFYIDGELQFRSADERLYHDALLEPLHTLPKPPRDVLVLGGGDGLAVRDLLKRGSVRRVVILDWDRAVTRLFRSNPQLVALNEGALYDSRVSFVHRDVRDAMSTLRHTYDAIIGDLSDPDPQALDRFPLNTSLFAAGVRRTLSPDGVFVTHAASADGPNVERRLRVTLESAGFSTRSYCRSVPSFGKVAYVVGRPPVLRLSDDPERA